jgi:hypothetical protein
MAQSMPARCLTMRHLGNWWSSNKLMVVVGDSSCLVDEFVMEALLMAIVKSRSDTGRWTMPPTVDGDCCYG